MKSKLIASLFILVLFNSCSKDAIVNTITGPEAFHNRAVGASANELLSGSTYTSLKVEVQYMSGYAPDSIALLNLKNYLTSLKGCKNVLAKTFFAPRRISVSLIVSSISYI